MARSEDIQEARAVDRAPAPSDGSRRDVERMTLTGRIAREVLHDVNNVLMGIMGCAKQSLSKLDPNASARPYVFEIEQAAERAARLTREFLAFKAQGTEGHRPVFLNDLISGKKELLARIGGHGVELRLKLDPQVETIHADPGLLDEALMSIALRARDEFPRGVLLIETSHVALTTARDDSSLAGVGGVVRLGVTFGLEGGQGRGRLERAPAGDVHQEAGVAPVSSLRRLIEECGGTVDDLREGAEETCVEILFRPVSTIEQSAGEADPRGGSRSTLSSERKTILVVDDEKVSRIVIRAFLERAGFDVLEAECAEDALSLGRDTERPIDLLLSDLNLPDMKGQELAGALKVLRPTISFMFMSGYSAEEALDARLIHPEQVFLPKPFDGGDLVKRVRALFAAR